MNKAKLVSFIAVGLLISNLLLIAFMVYNKPRGPMHDGPRDLIIHKLHFDENQVKEYDKLIAWHRENVDKTQHEMMELRNRLYQSLTDEKIAPEKDSLIDLIGKTQIKMEQIHYQHFEDLKKLCKPEQQGAFKNLTLEIARLFAPPPPKNRRP